MLRWWSMVEVAGTEIGIYGLPDIELAVLRRIYGRLGRLEKV